MQSRQSIITWGGEWPLEVSPTSSTSTEGSSLRIRNSNLIHLLWLWIWALFLVCCQTFAATNAHSKRKPDWWDAGEGRGTWTSNLRTYHVSLLWRVWGGARLRCLWWYEDALWLGQGFGTFFVLGLKFDWDGWKVMVRGGGMRRGCRRIGRGAEVSSSERCGSQNFGLGVFQGVPVRTDCGS